jgi:ribonuclease HI
MTRKKYYGVASGRATGVFLTWEECRRHVTGFPGAVFKGFNTVESACLFVKGNNRTNSSRPSGASKPTTFSQPPDDPHTFHAKPSNNTQQNDIKQTTNSHAPGSNPVDVWTDGSYYYDPTHDTDTAGLGVFFGDDDARNVSEPLPFGAAITNNRAEIMGSLRALQILSKEDPKPARIVIHTDSMYVIGCFVNPIPNGSTDISKQLRQRGYTTNFDLLVSLVKMTWGFGDVKFEHVKGHSGMYCNEMADKLSKDGSQKRLRGGGGASPTCKKKKRMNID